MLKGLIQLFSTFKIKNALQLHWMPLWYNSRLDYGYRQRWIDKGYIVVGDILHKDGELMSILELND